MFNDQVAQHFTFDAMALTDGDAEYEKNITVTAYSLNDAIDEARDRDETIYHLRYNGRTVWTARGIDW